jgi:flagellar biosynthesis protein
MNNKHNIKHAVGLYYDKENVPIVTAKGDGYIADKIIAIARENHIPIQEDRELLKLLAKVNLNDAIPRQLYEAVAQLLVFIYYINDNNSK